MYNSLSLKSGLQIWITQEECAAINANLADSLRFFFIPRIKQTFNVDVVSNLGIHSMFYDAKVKGADFKFTPTAVVAKLKDYEAIWQGQNWKMTKDQYESAMSFDDLIASQTV